MRLRNLFILNTALAFGFGVGFVLSSGAMLTLYGMAQSPSASLAGQLFGVELIPVCLLCWFVRDVSDAAALRAIMLALLIADGVGLIVVLNRYAFRCHERNGLVGSRDLSGVSSGLCLFPAPEARHFLASHSTGHC